MPQFIMIAHDGPDGAARRDQHRRGHQAHLQRLTAQGRIVFAGPIRNDTNDRSIGAVIVLEVADLAEARAIVDRDPYVVGGVFQSVMVRAFKQVIPEKP